MKDMDALENMITQSVCPATVAGWVWYCDLHDTHGNADSEEEARYMAESHVQFLLPDVIRTEHVAAIFVWQR